MAAALLYLALFPALRLAAAPGQQSPPPKRPGTEAHIVRIEYGSWSGMCIGYCNSETTVQAGMVRSESGTNASISGYRDKEHPNMKTKWKITSQEWERAKAAVDTDTLFSLPDRIGCPGCVDQPVDWISVEYSDGTKKSVTCNSGGPATDMADKIKAALARAPSKANAHPKLMLEDTYDYFSDDGTGGQGLLARVYDDGTVEYGSHHWGREIRIGRVSKGTIAQLGAILNSRAVRELRPNYPAFDEWGYTAMTYKIRFFSGGVEQQVTAINVLPVRKGHGEEYPTALLRLVCGVADIRDAVEPHDYEQKRGDCDEFPRIAKPNIQSTQK